MAIPVRRGRSDWERATICGGRQEVSACKKAGFRHERTRMPMKEIALQPEKLRSAQRRGSFSAFNSRSETHEQLSIRLLYCTLPLTKYGQPTLTSNAGATASRNRKSARAH